MKILSRTEPFLWLKILTGFINLLFEFLIQQETQVMTATVTELQGKLPPPLLSMDLPVEPSFVSLGPYHCAVGMNNRAWFFELGQNKPTLLRDREYLGTVTSLRLSTDYASVLYEGKIQLHMVSACLSLHLYSLQTK